MLAQARRQLDFAFLTTPPEPIHQRSNGTSDKLHLRALQMINNHCVGIMAREILLLRKCSRPSPISPSQPA